MNLYEEVKKHVTMSLRNKETLTPEHIKHHISVVVKMQRDLGRLQKIDEEALLRDIQSNVSTWQAAPSVLRDSKHKNWLPQRKAEIEFRFWKRYRQYLEEEKNWPSTVTDKLDMITDYILGDIGNPIQHGQWDRRGMVVGEVQSGKTANYTGLICKAVDAGYKLIIVLAGMTDDLRCQTQSRLDTEFLGFESEVGKAYSNGCRIGVGKIDPTLKVLPLTDSSRNGDFRTNSSTNLQFCDTPMLLVVKKNTSVLKHILAWVKNQGKLHPETGKRIIDGIPLLLIDDEADNASVNTKKEEEDPTAINRAIRQILLSFQQRTYVGYTATPFANIFILPDEESNQEYGDDLFPKGFIYYIQPPSNYFGPAKLFGFNEDLDGRENTTNGMPLIRPAENAQDIFPEAHRKTLEVEKLPDSLIEALQSFVITCAARRARGQKEVHNSMLIHVTRFNLVQRQVRDLIHGEIINMQRTIEFNTGEQTARLLQKMEKIWEQDYLPTFESVRQIHVDPQMRPVKWEDVRKELLPAITKIQVRGINGDAAGVLDYDNNPSGLNVIAVGGDKLSRGLTLEGLSVSYFIRPAKNYDTLLQMGRWFGYRPGYVDLCRLYTTKDLVGWYKHIAVANEELRREFIIMELSNLTPEDYGLKVRTHPDGLNITAANKIRHGKKILVSFSGHLVQTTVFQKEAKVHEENLEATQQWFRSLPQPTTEKKRVLWNNIPPTQIICFLNNYTSHPACPKASGDLLIKYIQKLQEFNELTKWTVALVSNSDPSATAYTIAGHPIGLIQRADDTPDENQYSLKKSNILSPDDEHLDLSEEQRKKALEDNIAAVEKRQTRSINRPKSPSGPFIRCARSPQNALLLIYPLDHSQLKTFTSKPIIGFAISFPESSRGQSSAIEYQVNPVYWRELTGEDENDS